MLEMPAKRGRGREEMKWAYIERVKGRRKITHRWSPIHDIYHQFKRGRNKGKFIVVMTNGKSAIATSIQEDFRSV